MKIVLCTLAINDWYRDIVKYALKNIQYYCNKHNYDCVIHTELDIDTVFDNTRAPCWYKIKLIEKLLKEKKYDYIVWLDADCQILKHEVPLDYFINKYFKHDTEIVLTQDTNTFNTGIMFIKNSKFNLNLMDRIWNNATDFFKDFHEQTSFAEIFESDDTIKKHVAVVPYGIKDEIVVYWANYYPGNNFLIHCARCAFDKLSFMFMMDSYYPFKLDEEDEEEYKERIQYLNDAEICRKDIDMWLRNEYVPRKYSARCKKNFNIQ
jgi:hypothetical protein